jgi:hypothetical protein
MSGSRSIEDSIDELFLSSDSNSNEQPQPQQANSQEPGQGTQPSNQQPIEQQPKQGINLHADNPQQQGTGTGNQQQPSPKPGQQAGQNAGQQGNAPQNPSAAGPRQGDITDAQGRVVARAGREAELYVHNMNLGRQTTRLQQELQAAQQQVQIYQQANALPTQLGLQPQDVTTAMQFMAHFRRDPVGAAQKIIAEVMAMGHNLDGIGGDTNFAAIRQMINEAVQPFQQDRQQQLQQQQQLEAAQRQITETFAEFPWAANQEQELNDLLAARPQLSLREAVMQLQLYAMQHQLDMNQPLAPQIIARQQGAHQQPANNTQQQPQQQQMQPNFARNPGMHGTAGNPTAPMAPAGVSNNNGSMRTKDIVRQAMIDNGYAPGR